MLNLKYKNNLVFLPLIRFSQTTLIVSIWGFLGIFSYFFRLGDGLFILPVFLISLWITGLMLEPIQAFFGGFIGHFLLDLVGVFLPIFGIMWLISGFCALLISISSRRPIFLYSLLFAIPGLYILGFMVMGFLFFGNPLTYMFSHPILWITILITNPVFNYLVFYLLKRSKNFNVLLKKVAFVRNKLGLVADK